MEQKLVQRCETEIVADACNASYALAPLVIQTIEIVASHPWCLQVWMVVIQ